MAFQNIYYERSKNLMHLWDDERGYTTFPYRKYAYKKDPYGQYRSMYGDKLSKIGKWEKEEEYSVLHLLFIIILTAQIRKAITHTHDCNISVRSQQYFCGIFTTILFLLLLAS